MTVAAGTLLHARLTLPPDFDPQKTHPATLGSVYSNTVHNEWGEGCNAPVEQRSNAAYAAIPVVHATVLG